MNERWQSSIGEYVYSWVTVSSGPFSDEDLFSTFSHASSDYPDEARSLIAEVSATMADQRERGLAAPDDEAGWRLLGFASPSLNEGNLKSLRLHFGPCTRYEMIGTELSLDRIVRTDGSSLRSLFHDDVDLRKAPSGVTAAFWGVGLSVVTSEGDLVLARRSSELAESPGLLAPAVAEGGRRDTDSLPNGAPDHFAIAQRGALEELGVRITRDQVTWLSLGASANEWSYGLLGRLDYSGTYHDLKSIRTSGRASHGLENEELLCCQHEPRAVVEFLSAGNYAVTPFMIASVLQSLLLDYPLSVVSRAFSRLFVASGHGDSHALPPR